MTLYTQKILSIDDTNLKKRIKRILNNIESNGKATTQEIAKLGMNYIQFNMPKDSGASARSIGYITSINSKEYHESSIVQIFEPHPDKRWNGEWFNIPWFMFDSDKAINHYKNSRNGNVQAMRDVIPMLRSEFYRKINLELHKDWLYN